MTHQERYEGLGEERGPTQTYRSRLSHSSMDVTAGDITELVFIRADESDKSYFILIRESDGLIVTDIRPNKSPSPPSPE